jgi:hypothetical protein
MSEIVKKAPEIDYEDPFFKTSYKDNINCYYDGKVEYFLKKFKKNDFSYIKSNISILDAEDIARSYDKFDNFLSIHFDLDYNHFLVETLDMSIFYPNQLDILSKYTSFNSNCKKINFIPDKTSNVYVHCLCNLEKNFWYNIYTIDNGINVKNTSNIKHCICICQSNSVYLLELLKFSLYDYYPFKRFTLEKEKEKEKECMSNELIDLKDPFFKIKNPSEEYDHVEKIKYFLSKFKGPIADISGIEIKEKHVTSISK